MIMWNNLDVFVQGYKHVKVGSRLTREQSSLPSVLTPAGPGAGNLPSHASPCGIVYNGVRCHILLRSQGSLSRPPSSSISPAFIYFSGWAALMHTPFSGNLEGAFERRPPRAFERGTQAPIHFGGWKKNYAEPDLLLSHCPKLPG